MAFGGNVVEDVRALDIALTRLILLNIKDDWDVDIKLAEAARDKLNKLIEQKKNGRQQS